MQLHDYQQLLVDKTLQLLLKPKTVKGLRALIVAVPGSGKTVFAADLIQKLIQQGNRILFIVDREELVTQTANKLRAFQLRPGFIKAGYPETFDRAVQVASIQTLSARASWRSLSFDVVIWDEAHTTAFSQIAQELINKIYFRSHHIGLTGSPWRNCSQKGLNHIFDHQLNAPLPSELIQRKFLVPFRYFTLPSADLETISIEDDGDYNPRKLAVVCNKPYLVKHLVQQWHSLAYGHRTIAFAVDIDHSYAIAKAFEAQNIPSAVVHSQTPKRERQQIYKALYERKTLILSSCEVLTKGFDLPDISCVLMARPTQSKSLYFQMLGRGSRIAPEKSHCLLLDQAGNFNKYGALEDLDAEALCMVRSRNRHRAGSERYKQCPICFEQHRLTQPICSCGYCFTSQRQDANAALVEAYPQLMQQLTALKLSTEKLQKIGGLK
ncbi:DEAD/DEAH box helicase [Leptolyngbya sp. AN10]|uniref:DEAD/DEAH box helicase n=1 Tax=Leptolyngbya sp. AN10 TaxID=3423365 RepID=UPI003D322456